MPYTDKERQREYYKKWYAKNREKEIKSAVKRNKRNRKKAYNFVAEYKKEKGCKYCDENESCCLDCHHVKDKEVEISRAICIYGWGIKRIEKEIKKCIVICSNCHRKLHAGLLKI